MNFHSKFYENMLCNFTYDNLDHILHLNRVLQNNVRLKLIKEHNSAQITLTDKYTVKSGNIANIPISCILRFIEFPIGNLIKVYRHYLKCTPNHKVQNTLLIKITTISIKNHV